MDGDFKIPFDSYIFESNYFFISTRVPAGIYMYKVNNRNTRKRCKIC